jgi:hypothetical protein
MKVGDILLICRECCRGQFVDRDHMHPDGAEIEVQLCPDCWNLDFDEPEYYDAEFNLIGD